MGRVGCGDAAVVEYEVGVQQGGMFAPRPYFCGDGEPLSQLCASPCECGVVDRAIVPIDIGGGFELPGFSAIGGPAPYPYLLEAGRRSGHLVAVPSDAVSGGDVEAEGSFS